MSEFAFQQGLIRLLTDARIRQAVFMGDLRPLIEFGLPQEQAERFLTIDPKRLSIFAEMVIGRRILDTTQVLPMTAYLMGDQLRKTAVQYNHELAPAYSKKLDHALAFARFLQKQFSLKPPNPPFLKDILNYEMAMVELLGNRDEASFSQNAALLTKLHNSKTQAQLVPQRLTNQRIVSLEYDVLAIATAIKAGKAPTTAERQPMHILICVNPEGSYSQDKINIPTLTFIEACDGNSSLSDIIRNLAADFVQSSAAQFQNFKQGCLNLCESLVERGVINLTVNK